MTPQAKMLLMAVLAFAGLVAYLGGALSVREKSDRAQPADSINLTNRRELERRAGPPTLKVPSLSDCDATGSPSAWNLLVENEPFSPVEAPTAVPPRVESPPILHPTYGLVGLGRRPSETDHADGGGGRLSAEASAEVALAVGIHDLRSRDPKLLRRLAECDAAAGQERSLITAWEGYNELLKEPGLSAYDARVIKARINRVTDRLLFEPVRCDQPERLFRGVIVQRGDRLTTIAARAGLTWELVARMNKIDPTSLRVGQTLRVLEGPLRVVVFKSQYELNVLLGERILRAYAVGHGKGNCTPVGRWTVGKKLVNPNYTHPITGEFFRGGDPRNPVGSRYIALEGADSFTRGKTGFAIHGTIEPDTIGTQSSLGCVRLVKPDIEDLYDLLVTGDSTVEIRE